MHVWSAAKRRRNPGGNARSSEPRKDCDVQSSGQPEAELKRPLDGRVAKVLLIECARPASPQGFDAPD